MFLNTHISKLVCKLWKEKPKQQQQSSSIDMEA